MMVEGEATEPLAVIFDMDGVLIDSIHWNTKALVESFATIGLDIPYERHFDLRGLSLRDQFNHWTTVHKLDVPFDTFITAMFKVYNRQFDDMVRGGPDHELTTFLHELTRANVPFAVGTGRERRSAIELLDSYHLTNYFGAIVTSDETVNHKPNPDIFLLAAKGLGVEPNRCIVIEDAEDGIEAAHAGSMAAIGFTGFLTNPDSSLLPHADLRINSFTELSIEKLQELASRNAARTSEPVKTA